MNKKVLVFLFALILMFPMIPGSVQEVCAEEGIVMEDIDYSYLNHEDALVGYLQTQTRGVYLMSGSSAIRKYSSTQIAAGGSTNAAKTCSVSLTVIVERYKNSSWVRVTSWTASRASDVVVTSSKVLSVTTGYKYRVRGYHTAGTDSGSSWTDSLQM